MVVPAPAMSEEMREDQGTIFVFHVNNERVVKTLRGHAGAVRSLAFLPSEKGKPPLLVSAASEATAAPGRFAAHVRLWDVSSAKQLADTTIDVDPKKMDMPPGLTAWRTAEAGSRTWASPSPGGMGRCASGTWPAAEWTAIPTGRTTAPPCWVRRGGS